MAYQASQLAIFGNSRLRLRCRRSLQVGRSKHTLLMMRHYLCAGACFADAPGNAAKVLSAGNVAASNK